MSALNLYQKPPPKTLLSTADKLLSGAATLLSTSSTLSSTAGELFVSPALLFVSPETLFVSPATLFVSAGELLAGAATLFAIAVKKMIKPHNLLSGNFSIYSNKKPALNKDGFRLSRKSSLFRNKQIKAWRERGFEHRLS